ncbi:MAG TPA: hybrid sensor histidine kinase/response regulator, partial [Oculatellaceae cyanobacterium]
MKETKAFADSSLVPLTAPSNSLQKQHSDLVEPTETPETLDVAVQSIEQLFHRLPPLQELSPPKSELNPTGSTTTNSPAVKVNKGEASPSSTLSVRVDSERLERMNNLVGELAINRNGLSLQNEQLQGSVRDLLNRFSRVQNLVGDLRKLSDQMLVGGSSSGLIASNPGFLSVASSQWSAAKIEISNQQTTNNQQPTTNNSHFDSLELDSYGVLHSKLQGLLEDMMQLEESVDDIVLFAKATDQTLEQQRQMLTQLRDQLMWARMLPLGEVLNRFPRILRDLCTTYHKSVSLKLSGASVLVDKAILEKLHDPLLHLLRNAFDHGIEFPDERRQKGKPEQGQIEIRAYHQGSQTIIEVRDDGQGLNFERIRTQAFEQGLLSAEQLATTANTRLSELIFEPGFSTASQVSELSGRGVGLDVVRSQMRSLKGTIAVSSSPGEGTTFTLRLPLTLTIAKLLVCFVGSTAQAIPSDSIEEIVIPKADQIKHSGTQQFLHWRGEVVPIYRLADLLHYSCSLPEASPSRALSALPSPASWSLPLLVLRQDQNFLALEIDRLVTEQELVIKPFGSAIAPPSCTYGCTILGDGSLIPVIDAALLLEQLLRQGTTTGSTITNLRESGAMPIGLLNASTANQQSSVSQTKTTAKTTKAPTILVVDDAAALRRTLALTLERAGCRVLQARDGREAIEQLQQSSSVELVICDIEMPNMNGFEFLSARRQDPQLSKIPVVMLTSRSNDKHRWLAMQLGATAYFTKP